MKKMDMKKNIYNHGVRILVIPIQGNRSSGSVKKVMTIFVNLNLENASDNISKNIRKINTRKF